MDDNQSRYGFSFLTGGLYDRLVIHDWPSDVVSIPDDLFCDIRDSVNKGGSIGKADNGLPYVIPPIHQTAEIKAWADYQEKARTELEGTSKTMERIIEAVSLGTTTLGSADVVAFMTARKARRDVLSQSSGDPSKVLPELIYPQGT